MAAMQRSEPSTPNHQEPSTEPDFAPDADRLVGRAAELALLSDLFAPGSTRTALMLTGEAGVGKTALLDTAARRAARSGYTVVRIAGAQFGQRLGFSGLAQLLQPLAAAVPRLPARQAATLKAVQGLSDEQPPELLAISNAVHALLALAAAEGEPLALVIDDPAWLDRPSAMVLGTVARQARSGSPVLLAASRTGDESFLSSTGIPTHEVRALDDEAATALVADRFPAMAARVRRRLVAEAAGNPLALLELPVPLNEAQQTECGPLPAVLPLSERLQRIFSVRVAALPRPTQELLLLAVLDGPGDLHVLERAVDGPDVLARLGPAERAGLVRVDATTGRLVFRHPLTRSAVIELSTAAERRRLHLDLAEEFPEGSERRVRHLAAAAVGTDDEVAVLLHDVAYRTLRRGDAVGALTALLRASELSGSGTTKARMLAEAACLGANITGDLRNVHALLDHARSADPVGADSLAAATAAASRLLNGDGDADTAHRLLAGAIRTHAHAGGADDYILREALHTLLMVCFFSGRADHWPAFDSSVSDVLRRTPDPLLNVLRGAFGDPGRTSPAVIDVLDVLIHGLTRETDPRRIVRTAIAGTYVDRLSHCRSALRRVADGGRDGGAVATAIEAHFLLANDAWTSGQWEELPELTDAALRWCEEHDYHLLGCSGQYLRGLHAAARGDDAKATRTADRIDRWGTPRGLGALHVYASHIRALSALGDADFDRAYRQLRALGAPGRLPAPMPHTLWLFWDFAEAATRTGHQTEAAEHIAAIRASAVPSLSPRLAMMADAAAAMVATDGAADALFEAAIAAPGAERWPFDWARVCLAYGERLRRAKAGGAAASHLEAALSTFRRLGAQPWCARAANELRASGVQVTSVIAPKEGGAPLTPQERQVAQLAATGLTNKQIAARLFLSPRTVAAHLRNVFPKLHITSRAGLRDALTRIAPP
ncbi:AAA family ATPase [Streptomyces sp. NPDC090025]|uniref:AAA family ATPase n=1 Tax=Streptomyces sp. NPDC090025 TaxID=3365922 RepID=UPI00383693E1